MDDLSATPSPSEEYYLFTNGWTMHRGAGYTGWRLRSSVGELVDSGHYRDELIKRYRLTIAEHH